MQAKRHLMIGATLAALLGGCSKEEPSGTTLMKPREAPSLSTSTAPVSPMALDANPGEAMTGLPPGHPPIGAQPAAPGADTGTPGNEAEMSLSIQMPPEFKPQKIAPAPFAVTLRAYKAPKVEGDPEDAYVSISALSMKMPFQQNLKRWCDQFELPAGKTCETGVKQQKLEGTAFPTIVVEVAGTFKGSAMTGPWSGPMSNFEMVVSEIETNDKPYYVKMIGPAKTVERWKTPFIEAIKAAK